MCTAWSDVAGCGLVRCKFLEEKGGDKRVTDSRKSCPMRHENGNCTVAGGFCTAVNDHICEALHNAFDCGYRSALRQQEQERKAATGEGLRCKYIVRKADTGEGVDGCFVLRPDRDRAAVAALRAYATATDNDVLATDILNWVGQESNEPLTLAELREMGGEPVWIKLFDPDEEFWVLRNEWVDTRNPEPMILFHMRWYSHADYGKTWLAYSQKPEEGTV